MIEDGGRRVTVRPEKVRLLAAGAEVAPGLRSADGVVREVVYLGSVTRYVVETDDGRTLVALRQNDDAEAARSPAGARGERVRLAWSPRHGNAVEEES